MAICPTCKVEIGDAETCPLCQTNMVEPRDEKHGRQWLFDKASKAKDETRAKRLVALETISVSFFIAAFSVLLIDTLTDLRLSWSLYPVSSIVMAWILVGLPLINPAKPQRYIPVQAIAVMLFLLVLDLIDGGISWSLRLAIPAAFGAFLMIGLAVFMTIKTRRRGINVVAYFLVSIAGFCLILDAFISYYRQEAFSLSWSSILAYTLIPVAGFLIYAHYRLTKNATLRRIFHL